MRRRARTAAGALGLVLLAASCRSAEGSGAPRPFQGTKIGFILVGTRDDLGYNQAVWEGSQAVARAFPDHVVLRRERIPETAAAERALEEMIDEGAQILFATSYGHLRFARAVARRHPEVVVLHQGGIEPLPRLDNLGTYFGTVYEPVYQAGVAAGTGTRSGMLGFVAAFPIPAVFNNVNAFTLGARSVNPGATIKVVFTSSWCDPVQQAAAAGALLAQGADVLTQHQDCTTTILERAERAGARSVGYHYDGSEAAPSGWLIGSVWDWRGLFIDIVRSILAGRFADSPYNGDFRGSLRTADNPFVLTEPGQGVAPATSKAVEAAGARFRAGHCPFEGPLSDREGHLRVPAGMSPAQRDIDRMNWFVPGVVGDPPTGPRPEPEPPR
jgi:simple sugar transport system substrate-binding protein/basic membrane protein A